MFNVIRMLRAECCIVGMLLLGGCGDDQPRTYPVTGTVTYRGKPVEGAQVMFTSSAGRAAESVTDAAGKFNLMTYKPGDGALPGKHRVTIVKMVPDNPSDPYSPAKNALPAQYSNSNSTPLEKEVATQGKNDLTFELVDP